MIVIATASVTTTEIIRRHTDVALAPVPAPRRVVVPVNDRVTLVVTGEIDRSVETTEAVIMMIVTATMTGEIAIAIIDPMFNRFLHLQRA